MNTVSQRITELSPEKRALLVQQLAKKRGEAVRITIRPQRRDTDRFPLSFAQQRLWFLEQLNPGTAAYNVSSAIHLAGPLAVSALWRSLSTILRRHEALRTSFVEQDGMPLQVIGPALSLPLPLLDLQGLPDGVREQAARRLARAEAQRPFDLAAGPLRVALLRLDEREHVLLLTVHHIAFDDWSLGVFMHELTTLYGAFVAGREARLPALPIQYADYAVWQREWMQSAALEAQLAYWTRQLAGAPPILELPTDHPRPPIQSVRGASQRFTLSAALSGALRRLSQREGATLFMTMLAAFEALLARYSGQNDIVIGSPVAGRTYTEQEPLIGCFVNTLALRTSLDGDPSFQALLRRVRETALGAFAHQDLPFERLVDALRLERDMSRAPLFQVLFDLHSNRAQPPALPGLALDWWEEEGGAGKYDLLLALNDGEAELQGAVEYNLDLFEDATIARMIGHLTTLLEGAAADPELRMAALPLLSTGERRQLLVEWNTTAAPYPHDLCAHQLFETQAAYTPDAIAVVFQTTNDERRTTNDERPMTNDEDSDSSFVLRPSSIIHLTYRELDRRANQLAHYLRSRGVGPEALVGISMERSLELVIALLGVLKAGGAYVPLDRSYPAERLAFMIEDSRARVLITNTLDDGRWTIDDLPQSSNGIVHRPSSIVNIAADWPQIVQQPDTAPISNLTPANPAYVIYTSGSTGRPKGVLIPHQGLVNYLHWSARAYAAAGSGAPVHSPIGFDLTITSLFVPLIAGQRAVLLPEDAGVEALSAALRADADFSLVKLTPTHLALLSQLLPSDRIGRQARALVLGGEALHEEQIAFWRKHAPGTRLFNEYGPTETVVGCTVYEVPDGEAGTGVIPIGRPVPNTQIYVLDRHLSPAPIGVAGELYIGGAQLARGYLNRPDLTAARFMPNPFARASGVGYRVSEEAAPNTRHPIPDTRLYKTGDLARYRPGGEIEYLGRIDHQVKIRGFRIELGEIEATLHSHEAVREALVLAREDMPGDRRLVAYIVPAMDERRTTTDDGRWTMDHKSDAEPSSIVYRLWSLASELRTFVAARLPAYMIPAAFVLLDAFPLTPNGKLDRRALPAPDGERPDLAQSFVAPRTTDEQALAEVWAQVLGVAQVGIHDNFFELGGDSIRSIQVLALAQKRGLRFSVRQLFQHQTIAALAAQVAPPEHEAGEIAPFAPFSLIAAEDRLHMPADVEDAYPIAALQLGMLFHSAYSQDAAVYHNVSSWQVRAPFDQQKLDAAIQLLAARHPILRTSFDLSSFGEPLQLVHRSVRVPLDVEDLRRHPADEQAARLAAWFEQEKQHRFEWTRAPLLRFHVHRRSEETFQLSWSEHHAILDGWSLASLMAELWQHYLHLLGLGEAAPAPPALGYREFVALEQQALASEPARRYWADQVRDAAPTRLPRWPAAPGAEGAPRQLLHEVPIGPELSTGLSRLARAAKAPIKSVLLAAHLRVLQLFSGQADVLTGVVANGRLEQADGERVLGLFLNTLPFRARLAGGSWLDLVRQTFAIERELLPFRRYPLAHIQRMFGEQPLFESIFNFVHFHVYQNILSVDQIELLDGQSFQETNFPLVLNFSQDPASSRVYLTIEANSAALREEQVAMLGDYYQRALAAMAADPQARYEAIALLSERERRQQLVEWNEPGVRGQGSGVSSATPAAWCLHELVEAQAARTPDAVAVVFETEMTNDERRTTNDDLTNDERRTTNNRRLPTADYQLHLTYGELDRRANQLAHHLRALGVGPDTLVGLCVERSVEMLVGLLGILKAGGAYLPLDPSFPAERLRYMLEDSQASVLVTKDERRTTNDEHISFVLRPSSFVNLQVVDLRAGWPMVSRQPTHSPDSGATADNLAYVIYTSGSTGRPKGVQIAHRAVANFLGSMRREPGLAERDTLLSVTTLSFDIAALELFLPLTTGARLALVSRAVAADGVRLAEALARSRATVMQATPATWRALLDAGWAGNSSLTILCGGEALPRELADRLSARSRALWNMYGPTETTIWSAAIPVEQAEGPVPVGRPIAETQLYVLDARMQLMPAGAPGELYIGGAGLARGYLNRPELTAERFIPNPYAEVSGIGYRVLGAEPSDTRYPTPDTRLYRTGDLACYRPDGTLAFLGRVDQQVKLRGYRIEIGEIEAALRRHPAVREAAMTAREDRPGDARLVAYIVPANDERRTTNDERSTTADDRRLTIDHGQHSDPSSIVHRPSSIVLELRAFLAERLPGYMLPSAFVLLDAFPLTPNGKLDRKALPAPDAARPDLGAAFVAPRSDAEHRLARIWEELLNVAPIGVTDDFFELGGHSLVAVRLMAQIKQRMGRDLPLATLFNGATIERLARLIEAPDEQRGPQALVGIQPNGARRPFFAVHPIGGNVLCYADLARALGPDQPLYGLQAAELADVGAREVRIEDMAADYVAAIRAVQPEGPYQLGGWSFGGLVAFEMAQQLRAHGQEVGLLALFDTHAATALGQADNLTDAMVLAVLVKEQALANGQTLDIALDDLEQLTPHEQLELVLEQVRRANLDFETELAWVQRFLHGYRARERAMLSYRPRLYPGRVTLFRSTEQDAQIARIQALAGADSDDPTYGWGAYSAEPVEVYAVPGYHNTLVLGENAEGVARRLSPLLSR